MKTLDMHSIIFQICKSNQIKRNYKRTSATMATKQVCWPHSHKPQKDSCQTSLNWNTGHLAETPVEIKRVFSSPLLIFALPFPVCCLKCLSLQCSFLCLPTGAVPSWRVPARPPRQQCCVPSLPTLLQRHSSLGVNSSPCWMSVVPKTLKLPIQRHILNCQANSQWEHCEVLSSYLTFLLFCSEFFGFYWPTHEVKRVICLGFFFKFYF